MIKTLSPFPVITRVRKNNARWREIHAQRCTNDADVRETKKPTDGELLINKDSRLHGATSKNHEKHFHIHSGYNNLCEHMHP
jgi:hypothetical protein